MLQIHLIVLGVSVLVLALVAAPLIAAYYKLRRDTGRFRLINEADWTHGELGFAGAIFGIFAAVAAFILAAALVPFDPAYWVIEPRTGVVESSTYTDGQVAFSGEAASVYALTLQGDDTTYVVDDRRLTTYQPGDEVSLSCTLQWVYGAQDQWNCLLN